MKGEEKSLVVVLGAHRSGTSAVTRGLEALGVALGDHLMPPAPDNNEKGFFEDIDVNAINAELCRSVGEGQEWHTLAPVPPADLLHERNAHLRARAIELLGSRLRDVDCFGLKDPRLCRLLPFWQDVFSALNLRACYVLSVRNPLSVAKSLEKRNGLPAEKCHYLWLQHVVPSVVLTRGAPRVLVDYDQLMDEPERQMERVARTLGLEHRLNRARLADFGREFLEERLRHARFGTEAVDSDPAVPKPVKTAVSVLADVASDKLSLESDFVAAVFANLAEQVEGMAPAMNYLFRLDNIVDAYAKGVRDKDVHIDNLARTLHDKDVHIDNLARTLHDKDVHIDNLARTLHDKDVHIQNLGHVVAQRDDRIDSLTQAAEEREAWLAALSRDLAEREGRIDTLANALKHKDALIQHLQTLAVQINHRLHQARTSLGWRLFWPVRLLRAGLARASGRLTADLSPLEQVQAEGSAWRATGPNPQFLLIPQRHWPRLTGWCWLEVSAVLAAAADARVYFDVGAGFDISRSIHFRLSGQGVQRVPLYVPSHCEAVRLDVGGAPSLFTLSVPGLAKLAEAPALPPEFLEQAPAYEALGGSEGDAAALEPAGSVRVHEEPDYRWRATGGDPQFILRDTLQAGWYRIALRLRSSIGRGNAKLYFDHGAGYNESDAVTLPFSTGERVERLYYLKAVPRKIRFDPIECKANFSIEHLHFSPITPPEARAGLVQRLHDHLPQYRHYSPEQIQRDISEQAAARGNDADALLYLIYGQTFTLEQSEATSPEYAEWIECVETPEFSDSTTIQARQRNFRHSPLVSVIMPVYNTPEKFLRRAIGSVLAQSYPRWELCVADDASSEPHVRAVLEDYAARDRRIKVTFREQNGHISAASNSAISVAKGEFIALLDHDDELAPHALHFVVAAINQNPSAQIIYSDEDKIHEGGNRSAPHFKPDWNPDLFFSQNYVSHLGVFRLDLVQRIGGFRAGVEGSQDQDLLLRCLPHVAADSIVHIPKVLYHWRMVEGSTALESEGKDYTLSAGIRALADFFGAQGRNEVEVEAGLAPNTYRVRYPIPRPEPLVSLLIPTRDKLELLEACVRSIRDRTTYANYEILILDNESVEAATLDYLERIAGEDPRVRVLPYPHPFNFSAINNYGARHAGGDVLGLINNDIEVISPEWLTEMMSHALRPEIGCVGAKLYYGDETIQHAGVILGLGGVAGHSHKYLPRAAPGYFHRLQIVQNLSAVTGACLVVRKCVYEQVGGLQEDGLGIAFNDVDFCLRVREAGYRNLWTPYAELYHHESKSRGAEDTQGKVERFNQEVEFMKARWGSILQCDPCYSRNLTLTREDFSLRD